MSKEAALFFLKEKKKGEQGSLPVWRVISSAAFLATPAEHMFIR